MERLKSTVDILRLLEKSNCRDCGAPSCMAFAAAVFSARMTLDQCPRLAPELVARYVDHVQTRKPMGEDVAVFLAQEKEKIKTIDLAETARRLGARYDGRRMVAPVLGKNVYIDADGALAADIHLNPWVVGPLLHWVLYGAGRPVTGEWVQYRNLKGGPESVNLFDQRAVKPLHTVADSYDDLFKDMLDVFSGDRDYNRFGSDISIILHPLPRVPILVCYWNSSDNMGSDLNLFFDASADDNIGAQALFSLGTGLAAMFEKFGRTHGAGAKG
jgi:hypothetical protein